MMMLSRITRDEAIRLIKLIEKNPCFKLPMPMSMSIKVSDEPLYPDTAPDHEIVELQTVDNRKGAIAMLRYIFYILEEDLDEGN